MPKNVVRYDILISCPGDISKDEIDVINRSIQKFNDLYSNTLNVILQSKHWSRNAFAESGNKPQALLNEQFVNDCDAAIAIMWTKFGTPTEDYGSGTEEEIENMLASKKQVFMYFSQRPITPDKLNNDEYEKVKAFKEKYKDRGVYYTYASNEELESLVFAHLSLYFLTERRISEIEKSREPKLVLKSIDEKGRLSDNFSISPFSFINPNSAESLLLDIKEAYNTIAGISIITDNNVENPVTGKYIFPGHKAVNITSDTKEIIKWFAERFDLSLPDDFFFLGSLKENSLTSALGNPELIGSAAEKEKYRLLIRLGNKIDYYLNLISVDRGFQNFHCIKLALQNEGTEIDEDVQVLMTFRREDLITIEEFPSFDNDVEGYLLNDCNMYEIFGINSTSSYMNYEESISSPLGHPMIGYTPSFPGSTPDYHDNYMEELNDIFKYSIYEEDGKRIVKLKFDYIKHHTTIAFPSVIFVTEGEKEIPYSITSKHSAEILSGVLHIQ